MSEPSQSPIGGYFGLELRLGSPYHTGVVALNSGRNALKYILCATPPSKIYIPQFTCEAIANVLAELNIKIKTYHIDEFLEPIFDFANVAEDEAFLVTNYFGLKDQYIKSLSEQGCRLIVDNAHSFFSPRVGKFETFYSPRKFFGIPDGGYAFSGYKGKLEQDFSSGRTAHLMARHDESAQAGYLAYLASEKLVAQYPMRAMSKLSARILESIDYANIASRRIKNFQYLHNRLGSSNQLRFNNDIECVALTYPYLNNNARIRNQLLTNNIFTATYWDEVIQSAGSSKLERYYAEYIVHLPIDQRYDEEDMRCILQYINL
jgi:hypothetical protein